MEAQVRCQGRFALQMSCHADVGSVSKDHLTAPATRISSAFEVIAPDIDRISATMPRGYRARPFEDRDREPLVEERNSWSHPMEYQVAEEWRAWERMAPD